jgi:tetratricopeptide (TPR) repeat protein
MANFRLASADQAEGHFEQAMHMAREAASEAEREGMLGLAATAMGDFGYGFAFLRRLEEAVDALRQSVKMAERAKSQGILATNRLRLGEVLTSLNQHEEAISTLRLAVDWYRQGGYDVTLPFVLIKWGTALTARNPIEAEKAFQEALAAAERTGDEMFQSMALQRLAGFNATRNLRQSAAFHSRALPFLLKVNNTGVFFQGASTFAASGDYRTAETWLAEGERKVAAYPENLTRVFVAEVAHSTRATLYYLQGRCAEALRELAQIRNKDNISIMGVNYQTRLRRAAVCRTPGTATESLRWLIERLDSSPPLPSFVLAYSSVGAGEFALRTGKWETAKRLAERALALARMDGHLVYEFENLLVLRAAETRLGNREQARKITDQLQRMAPEIGIGAPPDFGGRYDLKLIWALADSGALRPH